VHPRLPELGVSRGIALYPREEGEETNQHPRGINREPAWRQDGKMLAYAQLAFRKNASGGRVLATRVDSEGMGKPVQVGRPHYAVGTPAWRPRSSEVAYRGDTLQAAGTVGSDIWLGRYDSRNERNLTNCGDVARYSLAWSPDGRRLAYCTGRYEFKELVVLDVVSNETRVLLRREALTGTSTGKISALSWAPNGEKILFQGSRYEPDDAGDIGIIEWPEGKWRWVTSDSLSRAPRWCSSGERVLYLRGGQEVWAVVAGGGRPQLLFALDASLLP